jgi:hypothetical protein
MPTPYLIHRYFFLKYTPIKILCQKSSILSSISRLFSPKSEAMTFFIRKSGEVAQIFQALLWGMPGS